MLNCLVLNSFSSKQVLNNLSTKLFGIKQFEFQTGIKQFELLLELLNQLVVAFVTRP